MWAWACKNPVTANRFIYNVNMIEQGMDFKTIEEFFPNTKAIHVVVNPWRIWCNQYRQNIMNKPTLGNRGLTVADYIRTELISPVCSQVSLGQYYKDGILRQAQYILKFENIIADFKPLQLYFETTEPIMVPKLGDYRPYYTDETRELVEKLYAEDIARFGYTFD